MLLECVRFSFWLRRGRGVRSCQVYRLLKVFEMGFVGSQTLNPKPNTMRGSPLAQENAIDFDSGFRITQMGRG